MNITPVRVWLKKYWEVVAGGGLLFMGVFFGVWAKKTPVIVQGQDPEKEKIDKKVDVQEAQIQQEVVKEKQIITEQQAKDLSEVVAKEEAAEPALEKSPDATNEFLKQVGQQVRGEGDGTQ